MKNRWLSNSFKVDTF
jgi:hypothetical protein